MNKLPEEIRLVITKQIRKEEWELGKILDIVKAELDAREQCAYLSGKSTDSSAPKLGRSPLPTTSALLNTTGRVSCSFCKGTHPSAKCNIVTDPKQRKAILRRQGRCYVCPKKAHLAKDCPSRIYCFNCRERHHASICDRSNGPFATAPVAPVSNPTTTNIPPPGQRNLSVSATTSSGGPRLQNPGPSTMTMHVGTKTSVLLQTAKGYISSATNPEKVAVARLILDSGSKHSYISENLRAALNLQTVGQETLTIKVFGEEIGTLQTCDVVQFCVRSPYNGLNVYVTAYVVPVLCAPLSDQAIELAASNYSHLAGLWLAGFPAQRDQGLNCEILIGSNFYWHFLTGRCMKGESGPVALESTLGWILSGPVHDSSEGGSTHVNIAETHVLQLDTKTEDNEASLESQVYGRYEVKLPWKPWHPTLSDNYLQSKKTLEGIFSRLKANPTLLSEYDSIIREQEIRGIIERVDPTHEGELGQITYLPHHPVIRQDKTTTKVRIVYDASAKDCNGTSLNSCLYTGPCLLKTVAEIMARFRLFPFALTSDIEKAFLMISIWPPDRNVLRYLWMDDVNSLSPQIVTYRFTTVVFGVSWSPFLLNATLRRHIESYSENYPEVCKRLVNSLYVDDVNTGGYSVEEVMDLFRVSKQMMGEGGFNLRKWLSNSKEVMSRINSLQNDGEAGIPNETSVAEEDESFAKTALNVNETSEGERVKVLGLNWNSDTDNIVFNLSQLASTITEKPVTKRTILTYVLRFINNCRERNKKRTELTAKEIEEAEAMWICDMPSNFSTQKLADLKKHLGNFVDNHEIIRCQGRLARSNLSYETKHPILLPEEHYITTLIIWDCHKRVLHNGTKETLQELISRFWIKCIGTAKISSDELHTVLVEIEGVLNSRPLTYQLPDSLTEPLTPSHLVTGRRLLQLPTSGEGNDDDEDFIRQDKLHKRSRYISRLLDHYWNRWKYEYLVDLREHHRMKKSHQKLQQTNVGDVVTIQGENHKNRSFWRMGNVQELVIGRDNVTRGAQLLLANGQSIERPVQKLYPLEMQEENHELVDQNIRGEERILWS
eukprot:Seg3041.3 transcript_id=Seg3041.3/GoldUCD/mRNA.D3Y31 product="hypothetical protein" protein_id=Seg3041.3/GoldUCD/D3Y31